MEEHEALKAEIDSLRAESQLQANDHKFNCTSHEQKHLRNPTGFTSAG
jgi:hypothetical protein